MQQALIQFKDVHKSFGSQKVLQGINLGIRKGEITTIIGKSGGGKSVLLKHIIGLLEPDAGAILFENRALGSMRKPEKKAIRKRFSYMFQNMALFDSMNIYENIALPLAERTNMSTKEIREKVHAKMRQLDIKGIDDKYPSQLSGGMKKRVALARALVTDPEIILFDEPTTGLDPIRKSAVHSMISDYQLRFGFTGVVVSHEIPDIFYISQRVAMLDQGRIVFEGTSDEIQHSDDTVVQQFIQGLEIRHDELTGMPTHSIAVKKYDEEMARLQTDRLPFSLVVLTIENIDEINRRAGHVVGQSVLQKLSGRIQDNLRLTDTCSRYGMNKIMILLSNTTLERSLRFCEELSRIIRRRDIIDIAPYPDFCFSVSAGIVEAEEDRPLDQLLVRAQAEKSLLYEFRLC